MNSIIVIISCVIVVTLQQQQQCPIGHLSFDGKKCIYAQSPSSIDKSYFDAESDCKQRAANVGIDSSFAFLVSIPNAFANSDTIGIANNDVICLEYFIGLNNINDTLRWTDQTTFNYRNWNLGCPTVSINGSDRCVTINLNGQWCNRNCTLQYCYICEILISLATNTTTTSAYASSPTMPSIVTSSNTIVIESTPLSTTQIGSISDSTPLSTTQIGSISDSTPLPTTLIGSISGSTPLPTTLIGSISTSSPVVYPCKQDIVIAIDMSNTMINTNNRQNELNYVFDALASSWIFSSDSVTATAFGYGVGFFDIVPPEDYDIDYANFTTIKTVLQTFTTFQNTSLTRVAQHYKDNYLTSGNYDGRVGVNKTFVLFSSTADFVDILEAKAVLSGTIVHKIVVIAINNPPGDLSNISDPPATVINADFGFSSATNITQQINAALCA